MPGKVIKELRMMGLLDEALAMALDEWKADIYEKKVDGTLDIQKEKNEIQRDLAAGRINKMEADARSNWLRAQAAMKKAENGNSGVGGYTTTTEIERDRKGKEVRRSTTRTPAGKDKPKKKEYKTQF